MALVVTSAGKVRQRCYETTRSPFIFYALKALFLHLAANKGNPDLEFLPIDATPATSDGGTNTDDNVAVAGACTLYGIYLKKTGSTATYFKATDHATTSTTDGTQLIALEMVTAQEEFHAYPDGKAFASGIVYTENTTATGHTGALLANRIDGFMIVGA